MFAVVDAMVDRREFDRETLRERVAETESERGGFEDGVVVERVE